jgi:hypothetical protein
MSIGFGRSFQYVGLNRLGAYQEVSRDKGPCADKSVGATNADAADKPNEIWRRVTGIFPGVKQSAKERKRGLKLLTLKIQDRVKRATSTAETQRRGEQRETEPRASASGGLEISLVSDWEIEAASWTRVQNCGVSIEAMCVEMGCSRARLTSLLKEYCGMSASEFVDGVKFSGLKAAMMGRLREAATELWGFPGSYVAVKLSTDGVSQRREDAKNGKRKESKYFITRPEELFKESRADQRVRRVSEICAMLRSDFDLESWAISAGYESGAKLKRACLNVLGRTLEKLERSLAAEVVQFYLCAEDRQLREIALCDDGSVITGRARELYHGDDAKPEAPFEDEYAKFEELKAEWLARLWDVFTT